MSKTIEKQGITVSLEYCAKGPIGIRSPMSKTRPKQDIEEKWGDFSNVKIKTLKELWGMAPLGKRLLGNQV